jgi:hypothetical protein
MLNGEISPKSVYISFNNNTNVKIFQILSIYTILDGLSLKTISRYCPFKYICKNWQEKELYPPYAGTRKMACNSSRTINLIAYQYPATPVPHEQ